MSEGCRCCKSWTAAIRDLDMACERIYGSQIFQQDKKDWLEAYRNGIAAVENRFIRTMGEKYCPHNPKNNENSETTHATRKD